MNHAPTHSNILTAGETTKLTPTSVCFGDTDSIGNGTRKSMLRSMKTDQNQFVLKWIALLPNDYQKPQKPLSKRSQELSHCQYNPWNTSPFWHHPNPRTILVWNPKDSEYFDLRRGTSHRHLPTGSLSQEFLQTTKIFQESLPISTFVFLLFIFFYAKTSLTTETSVSFLFSTTIFAIIFWTFTLTHHIQL